MQQLSILHLSDLHYGSDSFIDEVKTPLTPPQLREGVFQNLHLLLDKGFDGRKFDLIIISGDITTRGNPDGLKIFKKEAVDRLLKLVRDPRAICIVPGNHDVKWGLDATLRDYFDQKFAMYRSLVRSSGMTTSLVPIGDVNGSPNGKLAFASDVGEPLYVDQKNRLLVVCINSSMRCGEADGEFITEVDKRIKQVVTELDQVVSRGATTAADRDAVNIARQSLSAALPAIASKSLHDIAHVTQPQLDELSRRLTNLRRRYRATWSNWFKVAVLHHHLVPFPTQQSELKPFDITSDAARVLDMLASYDVNLVLTGHKHQPYKQAFRFGHTDLNVVGGMTVGGVPPQGRRGVRHLEVFREDTSFEVRLADLHLDQAIGPDVLVERALKDVVPFSIDKGPHRLTRRYGFPRPISDAVEDQLFSRGYYKRDVIFDITVESSTHGRLLFTTSLSYDVINIDSQSKWMTAYNYDGETGRVIHASFNNVDLDHSNPEFNTGRGISVPCSLAPKESGHASLTIEEVYLEEGSALLTSYHPSTDLKVLLKPNVVGIKFDFEVLYAWKDWPVKKTLNEIEVEIKGGLLPYQGVRLNWRKDRRKRK